jgi:tight adherence protein B
MTDMAWLALAWVALATAIGVVPLPSVAGLRVVGLADRGRLAPITTATPRSARVRLRAVTVGRLACVAAAVGGGVLGGVALGVAAALASATVTVVMSANLDRRREARRRRAVLTATRLLVAELEAGSAPDAALRAAAEVAPEYGLAFAAAGAAAEAGMDVADALLGSDAALAPLAHAWRVAAVTGSPMADVLARVASDLADDEDQQRAVAVALAGPRSSAALLAGLPLVGIALGAAMGAHPLTFLLGSPGGRVCCCIGVALDAAGVLWTQRLMHRAQQPC